MTDQDLDVQGMIDSVKEEGTTPAPEGGGEAAPSPDAAPDPHAWRKEFDWTIDHNGQKIAVEDPNQARTWLQQGRNYSQRAAELNAKEREWQQKLADYENRIKGYSKFDEVDRFAKSNPDWWQHVEQSYQQRGQHGIDPQLAPIINPLLERLQKTEGVLEQWQTAEQQRKIQEQDQALDAEIQSIRSSHPNIDFASVDESGRTLEWRVLNHAQQNGIQSFRAAFRDYLHDKLVDEAKAQGRVAIAQGQQTAAKNGLLGKSPTPTKAQPTVSVKGKSYSQLEEEALKSLGLN